MNRLTLLLTLISAVAQAQVQTVLVIRGLDRPVTLQAGKEEDGYREALKRCESVPAAAEPFRCKADVLRALAGFYSKRSDTAKAEEVLKERLDVLTPHQIPGKAPDLDVGIALFDLQSAYEVESLKNAAAEPAGQEYFEKARSFYEKCIEGFPELQPRCDHDLADAEGLHGAVLYLKMRYDEAAPFSKAVVDRPEGIVRKEVLDSALKTYAAILVTRGRFAEAQVLVDRVKRLEASQ